MNKEQQLRAFVTKAYLECLHRAPDNPGLEHYTSLLINNKITEDTLYDIFYNSAEYKQKFAKRKGIIFGDGIDWDKEAKRSARSAYDTSSASLSLRTWGVRKVEGQLLNAFRRYKAHGKVLDCGCNIGNFVKGFRESGYEYVGVDQSKYAIEIAKSLYPDVDFLVSFLWDMKFNEEFDIAFSNVALQHNTLDEKMRTLPRIYQALKADGIFTMSESTVVLPTRTQLTHKGWIRLVEEYGFSLAETWHKNDLGICDRYLFLKEKQ